MIREVLVQTETRKKILAQRKARSVTPDRVFSLDTLSSNAEILSCCGGQAALVFRAIIGSYSLSTPEYREKGFTIHPAMERAIGMPARQRQRASKRLEKAGYIARDIKPGHKMRIRLTGKGLQAVVNGPSFG